jgi:hypothetical protein
MKGLNSCSSLSKAIVVIALLGIGSLALFNSLSSHASRGSFFKSKSDSFPHRQQSNKDMESSREKLERLKELEQIYYNKIQPRYQVLRERWSSYQKMQSTDDTLPDQKREPSSLQRGLGLNRDIPLRDPAQLQQLFNALFPQADREERDARTGSNTSKKSD